MDKEYKNIMEYYSIINNISRSYKLVAARTYIKVRRIISTEMYRIKLSGKVTFVENAKRQYFSLK